jgi:hypothetical protein
MKLKGTHDKSQVIEEPCEMKVSSTVLKTNGLREKIVEFNTWLPMVMQGF